MSRIQPPTTAWDRFWFKPADPTTLGLIRICCGLIVLYTTIAYSFDLFELFGKNAWLDLDTRLYYVHEQPVAVPLGTWETTEERFLQLPAPKNEKEAKEIQDFREKWGTDPRLVAFRGTPVWSIWFDVTDPAAMVGVQVFFWWWCFCSRSAVPRG
jgi:hypothetical protein